LFEPIPDPSLEKEGSLMTVLDLVKIECSFLTSLLLKGGVGVNYLLLNPSSSLKIKKEKHLI
jgi:hypothetical protein